MSASLNEELQKVIEDAAVNFKKGDFETMSRVFVEDCILLSPDSEVNGRKSVPAVYAELQKSGIAELRDEVDEVQLLNENTAVSRAKWNGIKADGTVDKQGKYMIVWKKIDGKWLIMWDIFN